jgi:hypothetical protein
MVSIAGFRSTRQMMCFALLLNWIGRPTNHDFQTHLDRLVNRQQFPYPARFLGDRFGFTSAANLVWFGNPQWTAFRSRMGNMMEDGICLSEEWLITEYKTSIALRDKHASRTTQNERIRAFIQEGRMTMLREIWLMHVGTDLHYVAKEGNREKYLNF